MNRRDFLAALAQLATGVSLSPTLVPQAINPEWVASEYEIYFYDLPPMFDEEILEESQ